MIWIKIYIFQRKKLNKKTPVGMLTWRLWIWILELQQKIRGQSYFFLITKGNPLSTKFISIPSILARVLPIRAEPSANATIKGKNTHYRPVQLLHQDGVDPPGGGGVRISSIVSFSLGVNGAPLTRSRAMMWTLVFCLCFLYAQNPPATPATRSCPKPHIISMDLRRKLL